MKSTDRHHIFWYHKAYSKGWAKRLRDHWYCSVEIPRATLHHRIHYEVSHIPVPRSMSIRLALEQIEILKEYASISRDDDIKKRLKVLMSLFDYLEPETHEALARQYKIVCKFYKSS